MLIIVDKKIPEKAKSSLKAFGDLMEIETQSITYDAISGHPDIFFTPVENQLVVAPNLPKKYLRELENRDINFVLGEKPVGAKYPETAAYNAVTSSGRLIHHAGFTDRSILKLCLQKDRIHVNQGYTRCNLLLVDDKIAITSDRGIFQKLENEPDEILYVDPSGIVLPGFDHGFFGGCCGILDKKLFILGSLQHYAEGEKAREFVEKQGMKIVELVDGPLYDGGGILFVDA